MVGTLALDMEVVTRKYLGRYKKSRSQRVCFWILFTLERLSMAW